jgi:hypothetical protein
LWRGRPQRVGRRRRRCCYRSKFFPS